MGTDARDERRSRRVLRQMDRAADRSARRAARRAARGPRLTSRAVGALALLGVVAGGAHAAGVDVPGVGSVWTPRAYVEVEGRTIAVPQPEPAGGRLRPEVAVTTSGQHAFLHVAADGTPVGYDPCRPVRYVVQSAGEPAGVRELVHEAAGVVAGATGLELVFAGETDEVPAVDRALIQPDRYGDGWAPVLVGWADEGSVAELAGQVAGVGGSAAVPGSDGTGTWLAAGRVVLDAPDVTAMLGQPDGRARVRAILVHELAHVVGLDHVDDPGELMHPTTSARVDLGPGDLQGLALVGRATCE
ncbi:matrixin family metalloprotease [Actinotalea sp. AC32]|nr:matrixin family metalloprotease [Actinotalea sp. AC32]